MAIIDEIDVFPRDGRFYLFEEITNQAGFFVVDGLLVYGVLSGRHKSAAPVRTALLELDTGIELLPVRSGKETAAQRFDLIRMTHVPDERKADAFLTLCRDHAKGGSELTLREFFFAASKLFRQKNMQQRKNAIGLYGELVVIDFASKYGLDLSVNWQKVGTKSKYDFALDWFNIEVKTTTRHEMIVPVKHAQLFNEDKNILGFCRIEESPVGTTLKELVQNLKAGGVCFTTLESRLALANELLTIEDGELEIPYRLVDLTFYECESINPLLDVSERVSSLSYEFDLAGLPVFDISNALVD